MDMMIPKRDFLNEIKWNEKNSDYKAIIEKDKIIMETVVRKKDMFFYPTAVSICFLLGMILVENIWLKLP